MALRGILGITVGLAAAIGGAAYAAKKLFGSSESDGQYTNQFSSTPGSTGTGSAAPASPREGLDPTLLEILACPDDKEPVIYQKEGDAERLTCTKCGKRYPVRDGIPVMLIDEATPGPVPSEAEVSAAKALISQGKPAVVGAGATSAGGGSTAGGATSAAATSAGSGTGSGSTTGSSSGSATAAGTSSGTTSGGSSGSTGTSGGTGGPGTSSSTAG